MTVAFGRVVPLLIIASIYAAIACGIGVYCRLSANRERRIAVPEYDLGDPYDELVILQAPPIRDDDTDPVIAVDDADTAPVVVGAVMSSPYFRTGSAIPAPLSRVRAPRSSQPIAIRAATIRGIGDESPLDEEDTVVLRPSPGRFESAS
jgi:hypothetical protein